MTLNEYEELNDAEKNIYHALAESDNITKKNEAKEYLNRILKNKSKNSKNKIKIDKNKTNNETKFFPKHTIIQSIVNSFFFIMFLYIEFSESIVDNTYDFLFVSLLTISLINFITFWIMALYSILRNDFKKDINKVIWLIAIILLPFTAFMYPDFEKIQTIDD